MTPHQSTSSLHHNYNHRHDYIFKQCTQSPSRLIPHKMQLLDAYQASTIAVSQKFRLPRTSWRLLQCKIHQNQCNIRTLSFKRSWAMKEFLLNEEKNLPLPAVPWWLPTARESTHSHIIRVDITGVGIEHTLLGTFVPSSSQGPYHLLPVCIGYIDSTSPVVMGTRCDIVKIWDTNP